MGVIGLMKDIECFEKNRKVCKECRKEKRKTAVTKARLDFTVLKPAAPPIGHTCIRADCGKAYPDVEFDWKEIGMKIPNWKNTCKTCTKLLPANGSYFRISCTKSMISVSFGRYLLTYSMLLIGKMNGKIRRNGNGHEGSRRVTKDYEGSRRITKAGDGDKGSFLFFVCFCVSPCCQFINIYQFRPKGHHVHQKAVQLPRPRPRVQPHHAEQLFLVKTFRNGWHWASQNADAFGLDKRDNFIKAFDAFNTLRCRHC